MMTTRVYSSLFVVALIFSVLFLAGCRRAEVNTQPTALPSPSPTPRSTALPAVPTEVPLGTDGNALRMVIKPFVSRAQAQNAVSSLQQAVAEQSGLVLEIELVERYAEGLASLCDLSSPSVAWLDGVSYMAASAQNCGKPELQIERETAEGVSNAGAIDIIASADLGASSLNSLTDRTFCRISVEDFSSWLAPVLVMQANGFVTTSFETVRDYEDQDALLTAVAGDDCDAAAIPSGALDDADRDIRDAAEVLLTSPAFPFDMLVYPIGVPLNVRITLNDTLISLASSGAADSAFRDLFGLETISRVSDSDLESFRTFIESTGLDFSQLGR